MRIDLNADLGEGVGDDEALLAVVTSANVATGAHAGGGEVLRRTVAAAAAAGVSVGAHPSYRDRDGFGRRSDLPALRADPRARAVLLADLVDQVMAVAEEAERSGVPLAHVKPHGALYNDAAADPVAAEVVVAAVAEVAARCGHPVALFTLPDGALARRAAGAGVGVVAEGFADRGYLPGGELVPRGQPAALHEGVPAMVAQARGLASGRIRAADGSRLALRVGSVCVHGDTPGAVRAARAIRHGLEESGWRLEAPGVGSLAYARVAERLMGGWSFGLPPPAILPFGDRGLLVAPATDGPVGTDWVQRVSAVARELWPGATVQPGLSGVLVAHDEPPPDPAAGRHQLAAALLARMPLPSRSAGTTRRHTIEVRYDGDDLAEVADLLGVPVGELVTRHAAATWTVAAVGFSPGFGYLTGDDPLFGSIPRRSAPRTRVPRGALALAAGMCAVYPSASPGGWQLIGSTDEPMFDVAADRPARLGFGDVVRFVAR